MKDTLGEMGESTGSGQWTGSAGTNFRDLESFNKALIANQGWKLISGDISILEIFKGR